MFVGIAIYKKSPIQPSCCALLNVPIMQRISNRKFMANRECSDFDAINFVETGFNFYWVNSRYGIL